MKVYFAGKFNMLKDKKKDLSERLINDYRSKILGDSKRITLASDNVIFNDKYVYCGPFYSEQASNGDFTSIDCNAVLSAEYESVKECDVFFVLFDENFSVGSVVELDWALDLGKKIIIYYKEEESDHDIKSEYWFSILNAMKKSNHLVVHSFKEINEVINDVRNGDVFYEV